ncbi:MAG: DUF1553 domain-containing protein [Pirellulales bacterium]
MIRHSSMLLAAAMACWTAWSGGGAGAEEPRRVEFNRDIRPILSDTCFKCHGPDEAQRQAGLHFDTEAGAMADLGGYQAIVPGNSAESVLFQRISAKDEEERMPPIDSGRSLSAEQIELIRRWIDQGAQWQKHWSLIRPQRLAVPAVSRPEWIRGPIDAFVLERLEREGLSPADEADKATLIRRVTLDLTGLAPTPAEVDTFLADTSPDAYENVVDRLLASPRYGERMAAPWLDAARYADTNGYQTDGERHMWRWRDWVIGALNANMPFDRFTVEQLAGDMLPGATLDQRIATGFNRNHRGNAEGGIIPQEYLVEYVVDRVETTGTVWLGLTIGCARCHDHKFDPVTQEEFYRLFAYFHNVPERGKAIKYGNSPPVVQAPTPHQQSELADLDARLGRERARLDDMQPALAESQAAWEVSVAAGDPLDLKPAEGLVAYYALDGDLAEQEGRGPAAEFRDGTSTFEPGKLGQAACFDGTAHVDAGDVADFGFYDKFTCAAWVFSEGQGGTIVSRMTDEERADGYGIHLVDGKVQVNLVKRWLDDAIRVETQTVLSPGEWRHVLVTYDGSRVAAGVQVYIDGEPQPMRVLLDDLNQSFQTKQPLRIGGGAGPGGRFHGRLDEVRIYNAALPAEQAEVLATAETVTAIAGIPPDERTAGQARKIREYYLEHHATDEARQARRRVAELQIERKRLVESFPTVMVMEEMPTPRDTHVLVRGQYDKPGEKVEAGLPSSLAGESSLRLGNRLEFARWLVSPENPLTARVAVNRYWQMYFGAGLVKTVDDFGSQGQWPSHPELLDWLASRFMDSGWDVKALQRAIVTSATYRQSSKAPAALRERDPDNVLLARGPRLRLSAETVRDQALAASGLLVERLGGPSVKPYQPAGLWQELTEEDYVQGSGEDLHRRSLYTFWKRTVAPPSMMTFDASSRETCWVRETRTNTPLQALTLMNDVTFVECARVLAQRVLAGGPAEPDERIDLAFRLVLARRPTAAEAQVLRAGLEEHLALYLQHPQQAAELASAGEAPGDSGLDQTELAAYTALAGLILNLDEAITKE